MSPRKAKNVKAEDAATNSLPEALPEDAGTILAHLYPEAENGVEYTLKQVEPGVIALTEWNLSDSQPTKEEIEAARLPAMKARRVDEFATRAVEDLSPLFVDAHGKDELTFVLAAHVRRICEVLGIEANARLVEVETVGTKALAKKSEVEAAATPAEVEAVTWGDPRRGGE